MKIKCDAEYCRSLKDGYCNAEEVELIDQECYSYDRLTDEELHKDVFYRRMDEKKTGYLWQKSLGNKMIFLGREMFERYGWITDSRTGIAVCHIKSMKSIEKTNENKIVEEILRAEKETGISPLYESEASDED